MASIVFSTSNPVAGLIEKGVLSSRYASGSALTVIATEGWAQNDICVVGRPGQESTEAKDVSSTTGATTITLSGSLLRTHPIDTPLFLSQFDQIEFERKASGGSFIALSASPFTIEWDEEDHATKIIIPTFVTTDTLRWRFRNSASGDTSDYSDSVPGTGSSRATAAVPLEDILNTPTGAKYKNQLSTIFRYFNDLHDEIEEDMPMAWFMGNDESTDLVEDGVFEYPLPTDFLAMKYLMYRNFDDQQYPLKFISEIEMRNLKTDTTQVEDDGLMLWSFSPPDSSSTTGYVNVHPTPAQNGSSDDGKLTFVYSKFLTNIDSPGDTLPLPQPRIYFEYAMYRIFYDLEENDERSSSYERRYLTSKARMRQRLTRQRGEQKLFQFKGQGYYSGLFGNLGHASLDSLKERFF